MKRFVCMLACVAFMAVVSACGTISVTKPDGCEGSLVWGASEYTGMTPDTIMAVLRLTNAKLLTRGAYSPNSIISVLDDIDALVGSSGDITYQDLLTRVVERIGFLKDVVSDEIQLICEVYGNYFSQTIPINSCDLKIIRQFIADQKAVAINLSDK